MSNALISVIVPVYNVELYVEKCIESLLNQSFNNIEIILVNDGSTDSSPSICRKYAEISPLIKIVDKKNGGLVSARKAGLLASNGEYITYVDSDDWIQPDRLKLFADIITAHNPDIISTNFTYYNPDGSLSYFRQECDGLVDGTEIRTVLSHVFSTGSDFRFLIAPSVWSKCFRRDLLFEHQLSIPENVSIGEDTLVTFPCISRAKSVFFIDDKSYMFRINPSSMTHKYDKKYCSKIGFLIEGMKKYDMKSIVGDEQYFSYLLYLIKTCITNELSESNSYNLMKQNFDLLNQNAEMVHLAKYIDGSHPTGFKWRMMIASLLRKRYLPLAVLLYARKLFKK